MTYRAAAGLTLLILAGCSRTGSGYPSLGLRPVEARGWAEPVSAPAPAPVAADPALDARIAAAATAVTADDRLFDAADRRATPLVEAARGSPVGGERWIAAQGALADLDARRAAAGESAGVLEDVAATRAQGLQPDYPALEAARADAAATLAREGARIATLQAMIPAG